MKNRLWLLLLCFSLQNCTALQKQFLHPFATKPPGYTHVVTVRGAAKTIYISGQVPTNERGEIVGKGDFAAQTRQVYENLKITLQAAGATFQDVVKMTTFVKDYKVEYLATLRSIRAEYLPKDDPPASTLVGVQSLYSPDVLIEIEAIAVVGK
jgi:enamine deaminase RidA (YjgF/YER057c/UK114 family)